MDRLAGLAVKLTKILLYAEKGQNSGGHVITLLLLIGQTALSAAGSYSRMSTVGSTGGLIKCEPLIEVIRYEKVHGRW